MSTPYASEAFLHQLLGKALAAQASDIHLKVGQPPGARVRGDLVYFRVEKIKPDDTDALARMLLGVSSGRPPLEGCEERTLAYQVPGLGRFRVSLFRLRHDLDDQPRPDVIATRRSLAETVGGEAVGRKIIGRIAAGDIK